MPTQMTTIIFRSGQQMMLTFTGWKNSSTTFCALKSSDEERTPDGINVEFDWVPTTELLVVGACRFGRLCWGPPGDLKSLHVKTMATARPAIAPTDRESWYQFYRGKNY